MAPLNPPLELTSDALSYHAWTRELDQLCEARLSVGLDDLPDLATREAYDAGVSPESFFEEVVLSRLLESDVALVDGIACAAPEHEDLLGGSGSEEP
jgi:hypothetical protein